MWVSRHSLSPRDRFLVFVESAWDDLDHPVIDESCYSLLRLLCFFDGQAPLPVASATTIIQVRLSWSDYAAVGIVPLE